jgi:hypothetical protein
LNSPAPPKKARGELASKTARKLIARGHYATLTLLANIFSSPFWFFENHRAQLGDHIENKCDDEGDER